MRLGGRHAAPAVALAVERAAPGTHNSGSTAIVSAQAELDQALRRTTSLAELRLLLQANAHTCNAVRRYRAHSELHRPQQRHR